MASQNPTASEIRIGTALVWLDIEMITLQRGDAVVVVTARKHNLGAEVIGCEIIYDTKIISALREAANTIERALDTAKISTPEPMPEEATR